VERRKLYTWYDSPGEKPVHEISLLMVSEAMLLAL
jgi:hypothetical protein